MTQDTPLRLVIFDVDGTLVDSQAHILAAMAHAFEAVGLACPERDAVLSIVGLSLPEAMVRLLPGGSAAELAALVQGYKDSYADIRMSGEPLEMSPMYPGARDTIDTLLARDDRLVGIATGKSRRGLDHLLRAHGLTGSFVTEQVADFHPSKPHPSMLHAALSETGTAATDAVMIGDTTYDIEMGRAAGLWTIGVSWGYHAVDALHEAGATCVVDSYDALRDALETIWES